MCSRAMITVLLVALAMAVLRPPPLIHPPLVTHGVIVRVFRTRVAKRLHARLHEIANERNAFFMLCTEDTECPAPLICCQGLFLNFCCEDDNGLDGSLLRVPPSNGPYNETATHGARRRNFPSPPLPGLAM